ncbi:hypothetical protein Agub_g1762 [Astrephomene gubernaculifera]|uniref:SAP domain-containing protein n=1 Tax=Astrephomene gubernaculifera TaxID=47775 RepID=A0AAD3HHR5_9CHLO|nr:hypothetical protein Agub_g1762 [Astrephomene gubernaculifera]
MVKLEDVDKLKVNELKAACKELGLEQSGNKAELVARLKAALAEQEGTGAAAAEAAVPAAEGDKPEAGVTPEAEVAEPPKPSEADGTTDSAAPGGEKQRAKIQFTDSEAAKFEATKVQVVNTAPADKPKQLTDAERLRQRKERFKDPDVERMKQRAQRFNLIDADLEKEKMFKRAERFGTSHPELDKIKKEQRAARFGIVDEETKKKQRQEKFKPLTSKPDFNMSFKQDDDFEAKKKARAERFAAAQ